MLFRCETKSVSLLTCHRVDVAAHTKQGWSDWNVFVSDISGVRSPAI